MACSPRPAEGDATPAMRLPPLRRDGGLPLVQALARRQPQRAFTSEPLDEATLSGVPWAATVVNRPELGGRTTPSAMNAHEVVLYAAMPGMLYRYEPAAHELRRVPASQRTSYASATAGAMAQNVYPVCAGRASGG